MLILYTNKQVDEQNRRIRFKYWQEQGIVPIDAILVGESLIFNESYLTTFNNSETVTVSKVEKMFDKYIKIRYWSCLDHIGRQFKVIDPSDQVQYNNYFKELADNANKTPKHDKAKKWKHYFATKDQYADVKYIFASTIHKVQGNTYTTSYINAAAMASYD